MEPEPLTTEFASCLTCAELLGAIGDIGHLSSYVRSRKDRLLDFIVYHCDEDVHQRIREAVARKIGAKLSRRQHRRQQRKEYMRTRRAMEREERRQREEEAERRNVDRFLNLPTEEQVKSRYRVFMDATSNAALEERVCAVCARLRAVRADGMRSVLLAELPNTHRLKPSHGGAHPAQDLVNGLLLERTGCTEREDGAIAVAVCRSCFSELSKAKEEPPMYSLANSLWLGPVPHELSILTLPERLLIGRVYPRVFVVKLFPKDRRGGADLDSLQEAMRGNVTSFDLNTEKIADMVEGRLMPQMPAVLSRVLSVTYVGPGPLPKNWLHSTFRVRRHCIRAALLWLKEHNAQYYGDIDIDEARLQALPEDDVPEEVLVTLRQETDASVVELENDTYVPDGGDRDISQGCSSDTSTERPDVIPLQYLGVMDTDLSNITPTELMAWGLANLWREGREGGYVVRHGERAVRDFGLSAEEARASFRGDDVAGGGQARALSRDNFWEKAFPTLFPFGMGGIEAPRAVPVPFDEHVRWLLEYHDRRFRRHGSFAFTACSIKQRRQALRSARVQMKAANFAAIARELSSLTIEDFAKAAKEEELGQRPTNPVISTFKKQLNATASRVLGSDASRIRLRSQIWSTSIALGFPSLWLTINPDDLHDPIAQLFAGEEIDLDDFADRASRGPDKSRRAQNIAADPFAAAKFFHFLIDTVLETLLGIKPGKFGRISREQGIFGWVNAYFGVVECQGRGTLHFHLLVWLRDAPSAEEMKSLLQGEAFRAKVAAFIRTHFRSHLDGLSSVDDLIRVPANPEVAFCRPPHPDDPNYEEAAQKLELEVVRTKQIHSCSRACLRSDRRGVLKCKRRAPWPLSETDYITETGEWRSRRTYGFLNSYVPAFSVYCRCNNDGKLLTNTQETNNITFYVAGYAAKKQGKSYNSSALLAKGLAYHFDDTTYRHDLRENGRMLLFRSINVLNRQQELPAPMIHSYLMGWGDTKKSHHYSSIFWPTFLGYLLRSFPELKSVNRQLDGTYVQEERENDSEGGNWGHVQQEQAEDMEENITIEADSQGTLIPRSQVTDYRLRGNTLEGYNLVEFFVETYERSNAGERRSDEEPNGTRDTNDEDDGDEAVIEGSSRRGRNPNLRVDYLPDHPKSDSVVRVLRTKGHNTLPDFIGYHTLPRRSNPDTAELYSAAMLMLFKPWRLLSDLRGRYASWQAAFDDFLQAAGETVRSMVSNIEHYHMAKIAADQARNEEQPPSFEGRAGADEEDEGEMDVDVALLLDNSQQRSQGITEDMVQAAIASQVRGADRTHGRVAVEIGECVGLFAAVDGAWVPTARQPVGDDFQKLAQWRTALARQATGTAGEGLPDNPSSNSTTSSADVFILRNDLESDRPGDVSTRDDLGPEAAIEAVDASHLLPAQRRAFEIITWHLGETLAGKDVPQLLMQIQGEGGTGKSMVIQTVTRFFEAKGHLGLLLKGAYTGIAASLIGGKTTHIIGMIPSRGGGTLSEEGRKKLTEMLRDISYLILDEASMFSRSFFAHLSRNISIGKTGVSDFDKPFGGINVILCGDFHQFPPVVGAKNAPLYHFELLDNAHRLDDALGHEIYEQFTVVVRLTEQVRVTDPVWLAFLRRLRNNEVNQEDIDMLQKLVLTNPQCPIPDFETEPWRDVALVTPRHAVRTQWNDAAAKKHCSRRGVQLFICPAYDTICGRTLTTAERYVAASRKTRGRGRREKAGLPDEVLLAVGMKVMVTVNVMTDLDVANGARGEIIDIVLDEDEPPIPDAPVVTLTKPPAFVLVRLDRTRATALEGLPECVIPIEPMVKTYELVVEEAIPGEGRHQVKKTVKRRQLPMTAAYAFTDYRSQGQTLCCVIVDIGTPPGGGLTLFNIYVALSRSSGRETIRLLRDFDPNVLLQPMDPMLAQEDERLGKMDRETLMWWERMRRELNLQVSRDQPGGVEQ